jgi:molecular chaperone HscB
MDAFDVLALTPAFDLDANELERRYRELQRQFHPDRFARAAGSERRQSLLRAVDVNQAYRTLRDVLARAELLLVRLGGEAGERLADPALLMEIMELREALAEAKAARDRAGIAELAAQVDARQAAAIQALREAFTAVQARAGGAAAQLEAAQAALTRLRYYRRFHDEVARFEEETAE